MGSDDTFPDWRQQEEIDELRIELRAAAFEDDTACLLDRAAIAVLSPMRDGVEGIGNGDDARWQRDVSALELIRVAPPVPALMMRQHVPPELGIETGEWLQHVGTAARVRGDGTAFGRREALDVVDDVEERLVDLADVVEQGDARDAMPGALRKAGGVGEDEGIFGDASDMDAGVGIVGVDGSQERFEGGGGHSFGGLAGLKLVPDEERPRGGGDGGGDTGGGDGRT